MAMASIARRKATAVFSSSSKHPFKYSWTASSRGFASGSEENDVVVIGGGPGGYVAAIKAAQLGLKTTCIEKRGALGGTCLNVGCIPSKALLHSSHMYHEAKHSFASHGVKLGSVEVDVPAMMAQKDKAVGNLTKGIEGLLKKNKVNYVKGYGKFLSPSEISVDTIEGGNTVVKGKNIIIATGSDVKGLPGIENKVFNLMSGTSMLNLNDHVLIVKKQLQDKGRLQLDGRLFHVSCCADFLCSLVMVAFAKIEHIIQKILPLVSCGKSSPLWDNTLRILLKAVQSEAEGKYPNSGKDFPSAEEWKKVRDVCKLVQIIYNVAEVVFETKHEGASTYFHNLQELQSKLIEEANISDPFGRIIAQRMLKKFEKYWENMFLVLAIVTVMDPRYKTEYIEFSSVKYYATSKDTQVATVLESIQKVYNSYVTHSAEEPEHLLSDSNSDSEDGLSQDVKDRRRSPDFGFNCLDEYNHYIESHTQPWPIDKTELEYYLEEPVLPWRKNFSVLSWWRDASLRYPTLSKMARDLLVIQFSFATGSEAYDTELRELDTTILGDLEPEILNCLVCTKSWFSSK